jgi:hypothetical protein
LAGDEGVVFQTYTGQSAVVLFQGGDFTGHHGDVAGGQLLVFVVAGSGAVCR